MRFKTIQNKYFLKASGDDEKDQDKDIQKHTQTQTNIKCFKYPIYAISFKSRSFKKILLIIPGALYAMMCPEHI